MSGAWQIPPSTLKHIQNIPDHRPIALLLRHSVREALPTNNAGDSVPITEIGYQLARDLGKVLHSRLQSVHSSPVLRCMQTAQAILEGAETNQNIIEDRLLGDPGIYVFDGQEAWQNWEKLGHKSVIEHLMTETHALPGMAPPKQAAQLLVHHMLDIIGQHPGFHLFITHDSLLASTVAQIFGKRLKPSDWPWYLEGAFFWKDEQKFSIAYQDDITQDIL